MPKGKAVGKPREYQEYCRDFLIDRTCLRPYTEDGIDVEIPIANHKSFIDVMLGETGNNVAMAECRDRSEKVKQSEIFEFLARVEVYRCENPDTQVAAFFFSRSGFQEGSLRVATDANLVVHDIDFALSTLQCHKDMEPLGLKAIYERYDPDRHSRIKQYMVTLSTTGVGEASVTFKVTKAGDVSEDGGK